MRTRFAPSTTGDLHVGGAWTALASWALAKNKNGQAVLRFEDLDAQRSVPGSATRIAEDLAWLGLSPDEDERRRGPKGPYAQSLRYEHYERALAALAERGLVYACDCSRADVARAAGAPHAGEEAVYPETCRDRDPARPMRRPPAMRLRVPKGLHIAFDDRIRGTVSQRVDLEVGDFVLRRGDGVWAYQLAAAVDDGEMAISHVVRGADLLASTPRQIFLLKELGYPIPTYAHVPLVVSGGERLAKRLRSVTIASLRERGFSAESVVGQLAYGLGLCRRPGNQSSQAVARDLEPCEAWRTSSWEIPASWV